MDRKKFHSRLIAVAMASGFACGLAIIALNNKKKTARPNNILGGVAIGFIQINIEKG